MNFLVGLCVGHDSLFIKYSEAPRTTLVTKDRVLAHNPVGLFMKRIRITAACMIQNTIQKRNCDRVFAYRSVAVNSGDLIPRNTKRLYLRDRNW